MKRTQEGKDLNCVECIKDKDPRVSVHVEIFYFILFLLNHIEILLNHEKII